MPKRIFIRDGGLTASNPTPAGYTVIGSDGGTPKKQVQTTISSLSPIYTYYSGYISEVGGNILVVEFENTTPYTYGWSYSMNQTYLNPSSPFIDKNKVVTLSGSTVNNFGNTRNLSYDDANSTNSQLVYSTGSDFSRLPFEIRIYS